MTGSGSYFGSEHSDGRVEFKTLGEVGEFIRGNGLQKKDLLDDGVPAIHYGQIHTHYGVWATETKSFTSSDVAGKLRSAQYGDLLIATTSEDDDAVAKATAWLGETEVVLSGDAFIYRHTLDPKYVAYFFQSRPFQDQKRRFISGTKVRRISGDALARIKIPVPPLPIQQEIVRILDEFSQLEAELEAELESRRRQYEYYRHRIIADQDFKREKIGNLGRWYSGVTPAKSKPQYWESGTIPWMASMDVSNPEDAGIRSKISLVAVKETSLQVIPSPSVIVVMRSNILRRRLPIGLVNTDVTINQDLRALVARPDVDPEYVYQVLEGISEDLREKCVRTDGSMAAVVSKIFFASEIPLPPIEEQRRIAEQLRLFDDLVNDLNIGLPAELSARRKQYEYYRDKLLTFKELER